MALSSSSLMATHTVKLRVRWDLASECCALQNLTGPCGARAACTIVTVFLINPYEPP